MLFPVPHPPLFLTASSNTRLLPDPVYQLGDTCVNTRLVTSGTALAPTHDSGLEPLPTLLKTCQGSSGVPLVKHEGFLDWVWM